MSVYSMTGFASGQQAVATPPSEGSAWKSSPPRIAVELRSVNSRFLDLAFRLPDELRAHEPALRELLTRQLKRGKVELRGYVEGREESALSDPPARALRRVAARLCRGAPRKACRSTGATRVACAAPPISGMR